MPENNSVDSALWPKVISIQYTTELREHLKFCPPCSHSIFHYSGNVSVYTQNPRSKTLFHIKQLIIYTNEDNISRKNEVIFPKQVKVKRWWEISGTRQLQQVTVLLKSPGPDPTVTQSMCAVTNCAQNKERVNWNLILQLEKFWNLNED